MPWNDAGLRAFAAGVSKAIDVGVEQTAQQIEQAAEELVPVDTGALKTSIEVFGADGSGERTVEAGQGLDYAAFVEYGTARQAAQPYMTPAATQNRDALPRNVTTELKALEGRSRI